MDMEDASQYSHTVAADGCHERPGMSTVEGGSRAFHLVSGNSVWGRYADLLEATQALQPPESHELLLEAFTLGTFSRKHLSRDAILLLQARDNSGQNP